MAQATDRVRRDDRARRPRSRAALYSTPVEAHDQKPKPILLRVTIRRSKTDQEALRARRAPSIEALFPSASSSIPWGRG
jgi:hypothetical protein